MATRKVGEVNINIVANSAKVVTGFEEARKASREAAREMKANMLEARGAMMVLGEEIGVHLPRHVQKFIAEIPGVAKAVSAAFNSVAVVAIGMAIFEAGKKLHEFVQKNEEAAKKNEESQREFSNSLVKSNIELLVGTDRINARIAALERKPDNGLKLALDEANLAAFNLTEQLQKAIEKERSLLDSSNANLLQRIFGTAGTGSAKTTLNAYQSDMKDEDTRYRVERDPNGWSAADALRGHKLSPQDTEIEHEKNLARISEKYYNDLDREISDRRRYQELRGSLRGTGMTDEYFQLDQQFKKTQSGGDQSKLLPALEGLRDNIGTLGWGQRGLADRSIATDKESSLKRAAEDSAISKKAAADRLRAYEADFEQQNAAHKMSVAEERAYWESKLSSFKMGSEQYLSVLKKYSSASREVSESLAALQKSERQSAVEGGDVNARSKLALMEQTDKAQTQMDEVAKRSAEQRAANAAALTETGARMDVEAGRTSPNEFAQIVSAAHADEARAKIAALNEELKKLQARAMYDVTGKSLDPENIVKQQEVQNQIDDVTGKARIQALVDAQAEISTTWKGMIDGVFEELAKKAQDTQEEIKQIATQTIASLNTEMAKAITGQKTDFRGVMRTTSTNFTRTGLQTAEGFGMRALGLGGGGKMGTKGNPMYTKSADSLIPGAPGGAGGVGSGLLGMLNNSNWASSLFGGKLFGSGSIFGGARAGGGTVVPNVPYLVGERGPELRTFDTGGYIHTAATTARSTAQQRSPAGGGGAYYNINVSGGQDTAAITANFHRALAQVHGSAVANGAAVAREHAMRTPRGK